MTEVEITFDNFEDILEKHQEDTKLLSADELEACNSKYNFKWIKEPKYNSFVAWIFTECAWEDENFNLFNGKKNPHNFGVLERVIEKYNLELSDEGPKKA